MIRYAVLQEVGGYDAAMIAGEEGELCFRIRAAGYSVHRLDRDMTLHDAAMTKFGEFWQRSKRAGHAYAQGAAVHGRHPERHNVKPTLSAILWGMMLPGCAIVAGLANVRHLLGPICAIDDCPMCTHLSA